MHKFSLCMLSCSMQQAKRLGNDKERDERKQRFYWIATIYIVGDYAKVIKSTENARLIAGPGQLPAQDISSQKCDEAVICDAPSLHSCKWARLFLKPVPGGEIHKTHILPYYLTIWCITKL